MAKFAHVTEYIPRLEAATDEEAQHIIYSEFLHACYEPSIIDQSYFETLEKYHMGPEDLAHSNIEALGLEQLVAMLTFILRADRWNEGACKVLLEDYKSGLLLRLLRRIAELDGTYKRPQVVTFFHPDKKDGYLSNWYGAGFEFNGRRFSTGEHWLMWQKARVFNDVVIAERIPNYADPEVVKALGKQVKPYNDETWSASRAFLMRVGLRHKFAQNERLANDLLATGSAALAEAAPHDPIWGVGLAQDDKRIEYPGNWRGQNLLGRALADVRSDLRLLRALGGHDEWPMEPLYHHAVWNMTLLELSRVPLTRQAALMYATSVAQHLPNMFHGTRAALRGLGYSIGEIHEMMCTNMGGGLPAGGWYELIDELAFQVRVCRL